MASDVRELVKERYDSLTRSERLLANLVLAEPHILLLETSAAIAGRAGVSAMSVTRFAHKLGFDSFQELRQHAKGSSLDAPLSGLVAARRSVGTGAGDGAFEADCQTIRRAYELRERPDWSEAVGLVAHSDCVYAAGFQTTAHLARAFVDHLEYVRPRAFHLDGTNGDYFNVLTDPGPNVALVLVDIFRYGRAGPLLAEFAHKRGVKVIVLCDDLCDWAVPVADHVFTVAGNRGPFMGTTIALYALINLLLRDTANMLGDRALDLLEVAAEAQDWFGQHLKDKN
ncbi:MurR/RpiR family transcriptional regulator [Kaustia mangrovi]|uniref:MurR/RpiR family transcriptional regulator n=1 Tax=Kaustia mangrovi TaxID=2593653 RepID=A0A7S8HCX8_9HYPH|nr:MurR/RpiR family transcriptional regulator [Kaustia mangrovi]QPC44101.1 MurR/RpiR family transcriptional regulator [Kaustia mangrovi]